MGYLSNLANRIQMEQRLIDSISEKLRHLKRYSSEADMRQALRICSDDATAAAKWLVEMGNTRMLNTTGYYSLFPDSSQGAPPSQVLDVDGANDRNQTPSRNDAKGKDAGDHVWKILQLATSRLTSPSTPESSSSISPLGSPPQFADVIDVSEIEKAVDAVIRQIGVSNNIPLNWYKIVCNHMDVKPVEELLAAVDVCTKKARHAFEKRTSERNLPAQEERAILRTLLTDLVEPVTLLQQAKRERELSTQMSPSEEEIASVRKDCESLATHTKPDKEVIAWRSLCEAYINLMNWCDSEQRKRHECVLIFEDRVQTVTLNRKGRMETWENALHAAKMDRDKNLQEKLEIEDRIARMIGDKETEAERAGAYIDLVRSEDPTHIAVISNRNIAVNKLKEQEQRVVQIEAEGEHLRASFELLHTILSHRRQQLENNTVSFTSGQEKISNVVSSGLVDAIPKLCAALKKFCHFHRERKMNAEVTLEQRRTELEDHDRLYGDEMPLEKQNLESRIRELQNITINSTNSLKQMADSQERFWNSGYDILPIDARECLLTNFLELQSGLEVGPMKDMISKICTPERRNQLGGIRSRAQAQPQEARPVPMGRPSPAVPQPAQRPVETATPAAGVSTRGSVANSSAVNLKRPREEEQPSNSKRSAVEASEAGQSTSFPGNAGPQGPSGQAEAGPSAAGGAPPTEQQSALATLPLRAGEEVYTRFNFSGIRRWMKGRVISVNPDGTYDVEYQDGDRYKAVIRRFLYSCAQIAADKVDVKAETRIREQPGANGDAKQGDDNSGCSIM